MTLADELFRVYRLVAPEVLGRKKSRKLMRAMSDHLAAQIPENGCGPIIGLRRQAAQFLDSGMRVMEEDSE